MKEKDFDGLMESVRQMKAIRAGKAKPGVFRYSSDQVKMIRERLKLSQGKFAELFKVSVGTLRGWEQGRRTPDGPALALLQVIDKKPEAVLEALNT
jgi:putative transcriptional regulator